MIPFLRWAGSKRQLLSTLRDYWPGDDVTYIEPFAGSACLFFDIQPSRAILGDLNRELVRTYRTVRHNPESVISEIRNLGIGREAYLAIRSIKPNTLPAAKAAARFLYLNHYCFNGLYRTNKRGQFNVPFGRNKSNGGVDAGQIRCASTLLKNARVIHGDFEQTIKRAQPHDFVYLDPPYSVSHRRIFSEYTPESFTILDLPRLKRALERLDRKGVSFLLSYADSKESREGFSNWHIKRVRTKRNIAGFSSDRRGAYEILVTNIKLSPQKKAQFIIGKVCQPRQVK
jgi:DNA adenine methylase